MIEVTYKFLLTGMGRTGEKLTYKIEVFDKFKYNKEDELYEFFNHGEQQPDLYLPKDSIISIERE